MSYIGKKVLIRLTCETGIVTKDEYSGMFSSGRKLEIKLDKGGTTVEFPEDVYIFGTKRCNEFMERMKNYKLGIKCGAVFEFELNGIKQKVVCPLTKGHKYKHRFGMRTSKSSVNIEWKD